MLVTPSLFRGRGARGAWDVTGAPLSADTAPCEPLPLASPWNVPPPPWNRVGGARLLHGSRLRRYFPATLPLRPGSRRVASLGGRGSGPSLGVWAAGAVACSAARDSDLSSGLSSRLSGATWRPLLYCPSPPELRRCLQEGCDSAAGPEAELSDTRYAGGDSPGGAKA